MDGERMNREVAQWKGGDPRSKDHPHQMWLRSNKEDKEANKRAFLTARADLDEALLEAVVLLQDAAQDHFITRLLFKQEGGVYDTPEEALVSARRVHETAKPMPKVTLCSRW